MKKHHLIWNEENKYWYCSCCGAIYRQPENWIPRANYCIRCRIEWEVNKNEKE